MSNKKSCWNHRVRKIEYKNIHGETETWYDIVEAFYESHKAAAANKSDGWTEDGIVPSGETIEDLRDELQRMLKALDRPVIEDETYKDRSLKQNE